MTKRIVLATLLALGWGGGARAQWLFMSGGSTVEGDYLRGLGVAAWGVGLGEKYSAEARSIDTDTWIRFNEYVAAVLDRENERNARHRAQQQERRLFHHAEIQKRILESPEARDVDDGEALNAVLEKMNDGLIQDSIHRSPEIPLTVDEVRLIPFKLAAVGPQAFSMRRLVLKQRGKWPLAFQDKGFDVALRSYALALEAVLSEGTEGKAQIATIDRLAKQVDYLADVLEQSFKGRSMERRNIEASARIRELKATVEMIKAHKVQLAIKDLDEYAGTTVNDLRIYMRAHGLQFAAATTQEERKLFPGLHDKLRMHYTMVKDDAPHAAGR